MRIFFSIVLVCIFLNRGYAQESSLLTSLEDSLPKAEKVNGIFRSTRVINSHSVEMLAKGNLDFRIMHRFGFVSDGVKQLFGLDAATMRMSFDYGISDNIMVGIGRSTFRKELDAFIKTRVLHQSKGHRSIPFSLLFAVGYVIHTEESFSVMKPSFADRSAYYLQVIAGRKFNSRFSLQLNPVVLHTMMPQDSTTSSTIFAIGCGARYSISKRVAITLDYLPVLNGLSENNTDPLSVGFDISTGGHTFQLHFSNTIGMNERAFISQTTGDFFKGDIRFGFNLSRIFQLRKSKN